jgi:hypothetical protein
MPAPIKLFYSYSHKDEALREDLESHLKNLQRQGLIEPWTDRAITGGTEWDAAIKEHLEKADVILLLVSAGFIASDFCFDKELGPASSPSSSSPATGPAPRSPSSRASPRMPRRSRRGPTRTKPGPTSPRAFAPPSTSFRSAAPAARGLPQALPEPAAPSEPGGG